ncbi:Sensor histidine kinase ComP [Corynebacterium ciconiae DSM 44920]|uniref:sensor histidine kinase n=1 Tax=Corynebacterium ciconiae TaxID=227319 RepID=UPI00039CF832|nr:histidine kinase [Corynebacterium ciconiae]WKD60546.1 Sensor histidine kinase ComP [Corynebacterium ciconiae DSM 44920]
MSVLRSIGWNALLAVACIPALIVSVVLVPWLPLLARPVDAYGRLGARLFASPIRHREASRWFDIRQILHLLLQLLISCLSFFIWSILGLTTGFLLVAPFVTDTLEINSWQSTNRALNVAICFGVASLALILLAALAWAMTWVSVRISQLILAPSARDVETSRALLADAFSGERRRIERELHDGPQQHLTALKLNLAAARLSEDPEPALLKAQENAAQALAALRATVRGIAPQVLYDNGLVAAVEELIAHAGIDTTLHTDTAPLPPLDETTALLAYHCISEALTNATRHGHATHADISILTTGSRLQVRVHDNGQGVDTPLPTADGERTGTGIVGLRERAAVLDGALTLRSATTGAVLELTVPLARKPLS